MLVSKEQKHTSSVPECLYNEKINIKFMKLLFLRFFATIKIRKILKLGTP